MKYDVFITILVRLSVSFNAQNSYHKSMFISTDKILLTVEFIIF